MSEISYKDIFELLAPELGQSPEQLRAMLHSDVAKILSIARTLETNGFDASGMVLAGPVLDRGQGAPLVAQGAKLTAHYVKSMLTRQVQDGGARIGPFDIAPSEQVIEHYRGKVRSLLTSIVGSLARSGDERLGAFYAAAHCSGDLKAAQECFSELSEKLLANPDAVTTFLNLTAQGNQSPLEKGVNASIVSMIVLGHYPGSPGSDNRGALADLGTGALLQDIGLTLQAAAHSTSLHAALSAELAGRLGASERVASLIRDHHTMADAQGRPILLNPGALSTDAKVLVTTNAFLAECQEGRGTAPFEIAKKLSFLTEQRYLDERAVRVLCRLLLPKVKAYVLEQAHHIASKCVEPGATPILWPVIGDKVPTVFLCQDVRCAYRTDQVSHIARPVAFSIGDRTVGSIEAGDYYTCPVLTRHLRALYEAIQTHARPA